MLFAFLNFMYAHWVARQVWESTVKVAQGASFRISDRNLLSRSLIEFFSPAAAVASPSAHIWNLSICAREKLRDMIVVWVLCGRMEKTREV